MDRISTIIINTKIASSTMRISREIILRATTRPFQQLLRLGPRHLAPEASLGHAHEAWNVRRNGYRRIRSPPRRVVFGMLPRPTSPMCLESFVVTNPRKQPSQRLFDKAYLLEKHLLDFHRQPLQILPVVRAFPPSAMIYVVDLGLALRACFKWSNARTDQRAPRTTIRLLTLTTTKKRLYGHRAQRKRAVEAEEGDGGAEEAEVAREKRVGEEDVAEEQPMPERVEETRGPTMDMVKPFHRITKMMNRGTELVVPS